MAHVSIDPIILSMSEKEAQTLAILLSRVGGDPTGSRRKHADSLRDALYVTGFNYSTDEPDVKGDIWFTEGRDR